MTSTLTRYTENMTLREQSLEDVWLFFWVYCKVIQGIRQRVERLSDGLSVYSCNFICNLCSTVNYEDDLCHLYLWEEL